MEAVIADPTRIVYDTTRGSTGSVAQLSHAASASPYVLIEVAMPPSARNVVLALDGQPDVSLEISPDDARLRLERARLLFFANETKYALFDLREAVRDPALASDVTKLADDLDAAGKATDAWEVRRMLEHAS